MKIGIKTYGNNPGISELIKKADFVEIMAAPKFDYSFLKNVKIPIVIHVTHRLFDFNLANSSKQKINQELINYAIKLADEFNSKKIIIHPGEIEPGQDCSEKNSIHMLENVHDKRILIENMPLKYEELIHICSSPESINLFMKKTKMGFCFDINHAICTALMNNEDYHEIIKEFIQLKPSHYHLGGQKINKKDKAHRSFAESELNLKEILSLLPKDAKITLETSSNPYETLKDLAIIREIIKELRI